jgi:hypothetical protein
MVTSNMPIDYRRAVILEQTPPVSLRRAEQVDQSIMAQAFRGELE